MSECEHIKENLRVCVSGGHSSGNDPIYEQETYEMGRLIAKLGFRLDYGFSNSGDDAILESIVTQMRQLEPDCRYYNPRIL